MSLDPGDLRSTTAQSNHRAIIAPSHRRTVHPLDPSWADGRRASAEACHPRQPRLWNGRFPGVHHSTITTRPCGRSSTSSDFKTQRRCSPASMTQSAIGGISSSSVWQTSVLLVNARLNIVKSRTSTSQKVQPKGLDTVSILSSLKYKSCIHRGLTASLCLKMSHSLRVTAHPHLVLTWQTCYQARLSSNWSP